MSNIEMLRELIRHMECADARVWIPILAADAARGDSVIRDRIFHIHVVQWGFLHVWLGKPLPAFPDQSRFSNLEAVASWGRQAHDEIAQYVDRVDSAALEGAVTLPFANYFVKQFGDHGAAITLAHTLLQVTSHSSHHRGQVNARLRELGEEPPFVDFIVWEWLGKPAADWPPNARAASGIEG